jgi:hypothetical protein
MMVAWCMEGFTAAQACKCRRHGAWLARSSRPLCGGDQDELQAPEQRGQDPATNSKPAQEYAALRSEQLLSACGPHSNCYHAHMQITWDYKTIHMETGGWTIPKLDQAPLESQLNELGREGWELVGVVGTNDQGGKTHAVVAIFKRPR